MRAFCLLLLVAASPAAAQEIGLSVAHNSTSENKLYGPIGFDASLATGRGILGLRLGIGRSSATRTVVENFCRGMVLDDPCTAEEARYSATIMTGTAEGMLRTSVGRRGRIDLSLGLGVLLGSGRAVNGTGTRSVEDDGGGIGPTAGLQASYSLSDRLPIRALLGVRFMSVNSGCATDAGGYFNCNSGSLRRISGGLVYDLGRLSH